MLRLSLILLLLTETAFSQNDLIRLSIDEAAEAGRALIMFSVKRSETNNVIRGLSLLPPESNIYFTGSYRFFWIIVIYFFF